MRYKSLTSATCDGRGWRHAAVSLKHIKVVLSYYKLLFALSYSFVIKL